MYSDDKGKAASLCFDGTISFVKDKYGQTKLQVTSRTENSGVYELVSEYTKRDWIATIGFSLLSIAIAYTVFGLLKRTLYYIVLGTFTPPY